jgi:hypothetical protein
MADPLAELADVVELVPSASSDSSRVTGLIAKASADLRQKLPSVDQRIANFQTDSTDPTGLDPVLVASVVATAVKRFWVNQDGATNTSETMGPYSQSKGFALRGDKDVRGEIAISTSDLARLRRPQTRKGASFRPKSRFTKELNEVPVFDDTGIVLNEIPAVYGELVE